MSKLKVCGMFALVFHSWQAAHAEIITYDFSGLVALATSTAYGYTIPGLTTVHGQFSYDTTSSATTNGVTSNYQQSLPTGFTADFGSLAVSASSYKVSVSHDLLQPNGSYADIFAVSFASNSNPPPASPLIVGGTSESIGYLTISLLGPPTLFPGSALPSSLSQSSFSSEVGFFSQTPTGLIDVFLSVTALQAVPEPDGSRLLLIGDLFALAALGRYRGCDERLTSCRPAAHRKRWKAL